jgi:hypothetical protein
LQTEGLIEGMLTLKFYGHLRRDHPESMAVLCGVVIEPENVTRIQKEHGA